MEDSGVGCGRKCVKAPAWALALAWAAAGVAPNLLRGLRKDEVPNPAWALAWAVAGEAPGLKRGR